MSKIEFGSRTFTIPMGRHFSFIPAFIDSTSGLTRLDDFLFYSLRELFVYPEDGREVFDEKANESFANLGIRISQCKKQGNTKGVEELTKFEEEARKKIEEMGEVLKKYVGIFNYITESVKKLNKSDEFIDKGVKREFLNQLTHKVPEPISTNAKWWDLTSEVELMPTNEAERNDLNLLKRLKDIAEEISDYYMVGDKSEMDAYVLPSRFRVKFKEIYTEIEKHVFASDVFKKRVVAERDHHLDRYTLSGVKKIDQDEFDDGYISDLHQKAFEFIRMDFLTSKEERGPDYSSRRYAFIDYLEKRDDDFLQRLLEIL